LIVKGIESLLGKRGRGGGRGVGGWAVAGRFGWVKCEFISELSYINFVIGACFSNTSS
jgi:hypothetical protein